MPSVGGGLEDGLGRCWQGMLAAMAVQDQPGHSLAATLRQKASLVQDLLRNLEIGLQHSSAAVRSASYTFWHTPSVQCTLGQHLKGAHLSPPLICATQIKTAVLRSACSTALLLYGVPAKASGTPLIPQIWVQVSCAHVMPCTFCLQSCLPGASAISRCIRCITSL